MYTFRLSGYQFFIEARDMKGVGNRATIPFTLNIIDVNDETPKFEKNPLDFILGQDGTNFSQRAFIKVIIRRFSVACILHKIFFFFFLQSDKLD